MQNKFLARKYVDLNGSTFDKVISKLPFLYRTYTEKNFIDSIKFNPVFEYTN